jgi:hypothetical protein
MAAAAIARNAPPRRLNAVIHTRFAVVAAAGRQRGVAMPAASPLFKHQPDERWLNPARHSA